MTAQDALTGTAGKTNNTLNIVDSTAASTAGLPAQLTTSNVQIENLTTTGNAGTQLVSAVTAVRQQTTITFGAVPATTETFAVAYGSYTATSASPTATTKNASAVAVAAAINGLAGSTVATVVGDAVVVLAATTGTALPTITAVNSAGGTKSGTAAITVANVAAVAGVNAVNYDVSSTTNFAGLTQLNVTSSGTGGDSIKAQTTTNVTDTNTGSGVTISGGLNDTVTAAGAITVSGQAGAVVATVSSGSGAVTIDSGTSVTLTQKGTGAVNIDTTAGKVASTGAIVVTDTGGTGAITISGGASATVTVTKNAGAAVTVSGVTGTTNITETAVSSAAIGVTGGTGATVKTTGGAVSMNTAASPVGGDVSITDTNTGTGASGGASDAISVFNTGAVTINTARNAGTITIGTTGSTAANLADDPTGAVSVTNASGTSYGGGTVNVYVNGAPSVSITGGATGAVTDYSSANALATVSLTGFAGTETITSTALSTVNITGSTSAHATAVAVTNSTVGHTLAINESGNTGTTSVTDAQAKTFNVTASGATADKITLTAGYTGKQIYNFANNSTGTLTVVGITDTNTTGDTVTASGSGAIAFGTVFSGLGATNATTLNASASTGKISATVLGTQNFTGGSGDNTITVSSGAAIATTINGGTGTNNTLIVTSAAANYATALGGSLTGFQNLETYGASTSGTYVAGSYNNVLTTGMTTNNVTFSNLSAGTATTVLGQADTSTDVLVMAGTPKAADSITVVVNGNSVTTTGSNTSIAAEMLLVKAAIDGLYIPGVTTAITTTTATGDTLTVSGAATLSYTVTDGALGSALINSTASTVTAVDAVGGVLFETYKTATAAVTGNTLPLTLSSATANADLYSVIQEAGNQTISINSVMDGAGAASTGGSSHTNTVSIDDKSTATNANSATKIAVTGAGNATIVYQMDGTSGTAANALATVDASGSSGNVNTTGILGAATGLTITGGSGKLTAYGSGLATGETVASFLTASDSFISGSGGATISLGYAAVTSGLNNVNLAASTAKADTINVGSSATYGDKATVSSFTSTTSTTSSDVLHFAATEAILANVTTATATAGADTYTMSNGIITFTGADSLAQMKLDARAIVDTGASQIAAFTDGTDTYVVASGSGAQTALADIVLKLSGVKNLTGFSADVAGTGVVSGQTAAITSTLTQTAVTGNSVAVSAAHTVDDTGIAVQGITGTATSGYTQSFTNLANSATINSTATTGAVYNLTTTQVGTAGTAALLVNMDPAAASAQTITTLSETGAGALTIYSIDGSAIGDATNTVSTIVSTDNLLTTLYLNGADAMVIKAITDTGLTSISDSNTNALSLGTSTAPITQTGLSVTTSATTAAANAIYLSGAGAKITASAVTTGSTTEVLSATGSGSTILGGIGATGEVLIVGANGTVTMKQGTYNSVTGTAVNGDHNANLITVGANSTVNLGTTSVGAAYDNGSTVTVIGDTTGATSSGSYNFVTVNGAVDAATLVAFFASGTEGTANVVNVGKATSLASALDTSIAAIAAYASGTHYYSGFIYGGDTYVVEHTGTGAAATALSATDMVVKLTGVVDMANFAVSGHGVIV